MSCGSETWLTHGNNRPLHAVRRQRLSRHVWVAYYEARGGRYRGWIKASNIHAWAVAKNTGNRRITFHWRCRK